MRFGAPISDSGMARRVRTTTFISWNAPRPGPSRRGHLPLGLKQAPPGGCAELELARTYVTCYLPTWTLQFRIPIEPTYLESCMPHSLSLLEQFLQRARIALRQQ